jgi:hypothetical protein
MDLGVFRRNKVRFWTYVVAPILLLVAVPNISREYLQGAQRRLLHDRELLALIPQMQAKLEQGQAVLSALREGEGGEEVPTDHINACLNTAARQTGVVIKSFSSGSTAAKDGKLGFVTVKIQSEGTLPQLIQFLDTMRANERLLRISSMALAGNSQKEEGHMYTADVTLQCFRVSL